MEEHKTWRFEVYNPFTLNGWTPLWEIEECLLEAAVEMRNELNKINAPGLLRIVRNFG